MLQQNKEIPKIIHQTWKSKRIPDDWKECVQSWGKNNPQWQYRLWTDEDNRNLIKRNYPDFLKTFDSYSYNIQRADAVRYFILYKYGGLYVDLDFECLRPIDDIVLNKTFVIGYEPKKQAECHGEESLICNAFMASAPGHSFLHEIIKTLKTIDPKITTHNYWGRVAGVLQTTGPIMINNVKNEYVKDDIDILEEHVLYPFTNYSKELYALINKKGNYLSLKKKCIKNGTYAIHYWSNRWVKNLAGPLINPDPFEVEGYKFYSGMDSMGYDIENVGRNISKLVSECNKNAKAVGFNTDGFLKYYIKPKVKWTKIDNKNGNEGLYIKNGLSLLKSFKNHLLILLIPYIRRKMES